MVEEDMKFKGFIGRLLFKLSGMKVISFLVSGTGVLALVVMSKMFFGKVSDQIILKAMEVIKDLALGLFIVRGTQNVVTSIMTGKKTNNNNGEG